MNNRRSDITTLPPNQQSISLHIVPPIKLNVDKKPLRLEFPTENPYLKIPQMIINQIIRIHDIDISGPEELWNYDQIMPGWINSILNTQLNQIHNLSEEKLYVYGAINGLDMRNIFHDIINYIIISIILNTPDHPQKHLLNSRLNDASDVLLKQLFSKFNIPIKLCNRNEIITAIKYNTTTHIDTTNLNQWNRRYKLIKQNRKLWTLYYIGSKNDIIETVKRPPHTLEPIILNLDKYSSEHLIESFGMMIPLSQANNIRSYVENNIVFYDKVITRDKNFAAIPFHKLRTTADYIINENFSKLKDHELMNLVDVYVPYNNRLELIDNTILCCRKIKFMYLIRRHPERSINKSTIMGSDIEDTSIFMIGYGTMFRYQVYELEDLIGAFSNNFYHPENLNLVFNDNEIKELVALLKCFNTTNENKMLLDKINEVFISKKDFMNQDINYRNELNKFSDRDLVKAFLYQIFYIGMYMRRWMGPNYPYPLKEFDTLVKIEPESKVSWEIGKCMEILNNMSKSTRKFCLKLRACKYNQLGEIQDENHEFNLEWDGVIKGESCIRMASTRFIGTGLHYLRALFSLNIPGVDLSKLDSIQ